MEREVSRIKTLLSRGDGELILGEIPTGRLGLPSPSDHSVALWDQGAEGAGPAR